jgi:hypothetical protein
MSVKLLSSLVPPVMTTTQRNAIPAGNRPPGSVIFNSTTNRPEINFGTDAAPSWAPLSPGLFTWGVATCVFSAAVFTPMLTVTHNLGKTPQVVVATGDAAGASSPVIDVQNLTATTFQVRAGDSQGISRTGNQNVFWFAIG